MGGITASAPSEQEMELRQLLREWRLDQGLSQLRVAKMMGTSQSAISDIERGLNCTRETFQRYVQALGLEMEETLWVPEVVREAQPRRILTGL